MRLFGVFFVFCFLLCTSRRTVLHLVVLLLVVHGSTSEVDWAEDRWGAKGGKQE